MPKTGRNDHAKQSEIPATLRRSEQHARDTFAKTYDSAMEEYDDESRAARTAWSAVKHAYEKVGDHWEPKDDRGPSDASSEQGGLNGLPTAGGVDANASKRHLYQLAQRLDIAGRSSMTKDQLVQAIDEANQRATRTASTKG